MNSLESKKLSGKVAVVTGASKGIGASIAKHLAQAGASVVVNYSSSKADADKVVAEITAKGGKAVAVQANVAKKPEVDRLFAEAKKNYGQVDILVNNAGIYEPAPIDAVTEEHFYRQFNLNVLGLLYATQAAVRQFGAEGGNILNISSLVSTWGAPNMSVYSATKGAVDSITRSLAKELGARKIRVNAVNPGLVITEGVQAAGFSGGEFHRQYEAMAPLGRAGQPEDIAQAVTFLVSPEASWITGETHTVSGGVR
ncbi:MAG TPA: glucose 1-dehydrogenase [Opitutales bacterium]|jgi:3-oxoacyl-[acyl-carrier protein] reductase|nr:glucose 1-dehydrogenase [Opitutales bacterium]